MTCLSELGLAGQTIEVSFVRDAAMKRLNARTRNKDSATDVLSFPYVEGKNGRVVIPSWQAEQPLGSIVISIDTAKRQAKTFEHSVRDEVVRLLVHGVCHVVGFDHERSARDEKIMFAMEDRLLAVLRGA